eukprot:TRINITY_DN3090_c0_g1_i1.p1 TRINITY_DN3090_c0_g1~~TRINITY_DN3090_c0_g1_i1.p1  ORF type:complete len:409 (-),score=70.09 TRINITY_DN3090_c0_g1_i1:44-1270(-)
MMFSGSPYQGGRSSFEARSARGSVQGGALGRRLAQLARAPPPSASLPLDAEVEREFGGRFLGDYTKKRLLGRGACGAVWLATSSRHPGPVAVKQVAKGSDAKTRADERAAASEIAIGGLLFEANGAPRPELAECVGMRHITRLFGALETRHDLWLVMEYGGDPLSKALFEIKGEFASRGAAQPRERVYRVHHLPLLQAMKQDPSVLRRLLAQVLEALFVLEDMGIVHADLKPDNLLLDTSKGEPRIRLCDFGSAFIFDNPGQLVLATPEYMPPEALEACVAHAQGCVTACAPVTQPWSFDIWSLGAILLELAYGVPHWLSYKCRVRGHDGRKDHTLVGLFAVQARDHDRILQRQQDVCAEGGLWSRLKDAPGIPVCAEMLDLLEAMLQWDPNLRISPEDALRHAFMAD